MAATITWNDKLTLCLSDVDETIADIYMPAEPAMIEELSAFLADGYKLFIVSGAGLNRVTSGVTDPLDPALRRNIIISHCSGVEVRGFDEHGTLRDKPFYSIYEDTFTPEMKQLWRDKTQQIVTRFGLRPHPVEPVLEFKKKFTDPLDIMFDDRGPQITLEVVNGWDMTEEQAAALPHDIPVTHGSLDLRIPILEFAAQLFEQFKIPVTPRLGGEFAVDLAVEGVSKTTSITKVLTDPAALATIGLTPADIQDSASLEIWGDKFSTIRGGTDRHISEAVPKTVRSIDFREENPSEFEPGYNIVIWDGDKHLHHGLLEYLQFRPHRQ